MVTIPQALGAWRPDLPEVGNPGCTHVDNVLPGVGCYEPVASAALFNGTTLPDRPLGAVAVRDSLQNPIVFVGTGNALFRFDVNSNGWVDVSKSGGYFNSSTERWRFAQFGSAVIATNYVDPPQYFDTNTSLAFADLTPLVRGRQVATVRDFLVFGDTEDQFDSQKTNRVRWSAFNNIRDFDNTKVLETQSDFQDLPTGGALQYIIGGEEGTILCNRSIYKMSYIGPPFVWRFDEIEPGIGCRTSNSVATVDSRTFFMSDNGFFMIQGDQLSPIGAGKIDRWFFNNADLSQFDRMTAVADPERSLVRWLFVSADSPDGTPDRMLIYNYQTGEWSTAESPRATFIFGSMSQSTTLDQLTKYGTLEQVPASLDSSIWTGGAAVLWGLDDDGRIYTFTGPAQTAIMDTGELHLSSLLNSVTKDEKMLSDRAQVQGVRVTLYGNGNVFARVGSKTLVDGEIFYTPMQPRSLRTGFSHFRKEGRYFRIRIIISGEWNRASSIEVDAIPAGMR